MDTRKTADEYVFVIVVLGVTPNKDTSVACQMVTRVDAAIKLIEKHPNSSCIVTGGGCHFENQDSEAKLMQKILISNGVNDNIISLEEEARNTFENVYFSSKKISEMSKSNKVKVIVCTEKYHAYRVKLILHMFGIDIHHDYLPNMNETMPLYRKIWLVLREPIAIVKDISVMAYLKCMRQPVI